GAGPWTSPTPRDTPGLAPVPDAQDVPAVAFSPDGRTLATGSGSYDPEKPGGRLRLWDVTNPRKPTRLASVPDDQDVYAVAFSPDGHTLATTSTYRDKPGGRLRLWDVTNPRKPTPVASFDDYQDVYAVAFSPDGHTLATGSRSSDPEKPGGRLSVWDIEWTAGVSARLRASACAAAGRGLSEEEWESAAPGIPYQQTCP